MEDLRARMKDLEVKVNQLESKQLIAANDAEHKERDFEDLKKRIDSLQAGINKLLWAGGLLVLTAFGNFVLNGGLRGL